MMSPLRTAIIFAGLAGALADQVAMLQSTVEAKKAKDDSIATAELVDDATYDLDDPLKCERTETAKVESVTSLVEEPATPSAQTTEEAETTEPAGTDTVRLALQLTTLFLVYDGLRKWHAEGKRAKALRTPASEAAAWGDMVKAAKSGDDRSFKKYIDTCYTVPMHADAWGCTPLHFAAAGGSAVITQELLKWGAEVDALDAVDETPLHIAARSGRVSICDLLVKAGANINAVNKQGKTALVVAGLANQEPTCRFLADNGGGAADLKDEELPPLVVSQVVRKVLAD